MLLRCLVSGICFSSLTVFIATSAFAQNRSGIFVTPVPNAPFRGVVEVQRSTVQKNGTVMDLKSTHVIARDSTGHVYTETRRWLPISSTAAPALLRVLMYDPQQRVTTLLFPKRQLYRKIVLNRPPPMEPPRASESPTAAALRPLQTPHRRPARAALLPAASPKSEHPAAAEPLSNLRSEPLIPPAAPPNSQVSIEMPYFNYA